MKKRLIISTIIVMLFSVLFHSAYKIIKIPIFPVNESIWEHGKMIILAFICLIIVDKIFYKDKTNIIFSSFISTLICIILDFVVYTPIYLYILKTEDNMFVTILIYLICIIISLIVKLYYLRDEKSHKTEILSIIGYGLLMMVFLILTYYPLELKIFYDFNKKIYGLGKNSLKI